MKFFIKIKFKYLSVSGWRLLVQFTVFLSMEGTKKRKGKNSDPVTATHSARCRYILSQNDWLFLLCGACLMLTWTPPFITPAFSQPLRLQRGTSIYLLCPIFWDFVLRLMFYCTKDRRHPMALVQVLSVGNPWKETDTCCTLSAPWSQEKKKLIAKETKLFRLKTPSCHWILELWSMFRIRIDFIAYPAV